MYSIIEIDVVRKTSLSRLSFACSSSNVLVATDTSIITPNVIHLSI